MPCFYLNINQEKHIKRIKLFKITTVLLCCIVKYYLIMCVMHQFDLTKPSDQQIIQMYFPN